jgi:hypothetical protein
MAIYEARQKSGLLRMAEFNIARLAQDIMDFHSIDRLWVIQAVS